MATEQEPKTGPATADGGIMPPFPDRRRKMRRVSDQEREPMQAGIGVTLDDSVSDELIQSDLTLNAAKTDLFRALARLTQEGISFVVFLTEQAKKEAEEKAGRR